MRARGVTVGCLFVALVGVVVGAVPARADGVRYVDEIFTGVVATNNIVYGQAYNSRGELEQLKLDMYAPAGDTATDRGLYIWIHGGNFREGSKASTAPMDYVRRGWVTMSINYRLRPELPGNGALGALIEPNQLDPFIAAVKDAQHDAQAAVRYARAHAATLGIDPNRIAVGGMSAGAITSLMVAFNPNDPGSSGTPEVSSAVQAAISHAGTYAPVLLGAFPQPGAPPIAMYHGTSDEQVPYPLAPIPCVLTLAVLNTCEFVTFAFRNHHTMGQDLARDFLYRQVIKQRAATETPLVLGATDDIRAVVGVEPAASTLGVDVGAVVPTDTQLIADETIYLLTYALNALGIAV